MVTPDVMGHIDPGGLGLLNIWLGRRDDVHGDDGTYGSVARAS
jgi:hypothetical protein